jgi:hypothetical protein
LVAATGVGVGSWLRNMMMLSARSQIAQRMKDANPSRDGVAGARDGVAGDEEGDRVQDAEPPDPYREHACTEDQHRGGEYEDGESY